MAKLRRLFGGINMSWPLVIALAFGSGIYTGLINCVGFLEDTSFRDIAINLEAWIVLAIFVVINCKKWWEASLKCFVFFLISQPLVYLVEVPFNSMGWELFMYYKYWAICTVLTLPGAAIAFFIKKNNILSSIILSVATTLLFVLGANYIPMMIKVFPHHLLSIVFCFVSAILLIFIILEKKSERIVAFISTAGFIAILCVAMYFINQSSTVVGTYVI